VSTDRAASSQQGAEPVVLDRRYRLGAQIGEGGRATVHQAQDLLLHRDVAVKVFRARAITPEAVRLQEAEAQVIASLNHYALVTLFDAGVEGAGSDAPQIYLVMEHVRGGDLRSRLREGPLSVAEACWLGFDLAEALGYVHQAGFLHRDIKPANVLLSDLTSAKPIVAKLADFGIASLIGERDTSEFTTGTAAYLSPEQVEGLDAVPQSDVYSLGLVILEAITGHAEFPGTVERSAFARLERDPHVPADLPPLVAEVLRGMTALEPDKRMPLVEVALKLQQHLVDELIGLRELDPALVQETEAARVAALHRYDILDTGPDETFDAITRIASRVLDAPIALVTLVDLNRVWFKSHQGWDETQVGRDIAFCSTTIPDTPGPWTIPDALKDPRTRDNPLVTDGPTVRSYAGAPLITRDGHNLGSLCVFDREARTFTPEQIASLADLAGLVMHEMEIRSATRRALFSRE
jgi:eukaryotic-like serine/threonine-protein kinase